MCRRGNAIQLGTHPNPLVGYEGDTIGGAGSPDYHGAYFQQFIKTAGKLQLQQAAAMIDVRNAELALRKARIALITQVQARYYAVLVAEEAMRTNEALARFTDQAYRIQIEQLRGGEAAAYEPMQLRVLAIQALATLVQARNRYYSAWKQLAAVVNRPDMPPTQLAGNLSIPIPMLRYEPLKNMVWDMHPDILAARNGEEKAASCCGSKRSRRSLTCTSTSRCKKITRSARPPKLQHADRHAHAVLIRTAVVSCRPKVNWLRAAIGHAQRRNDLTTQLADAFERYENNRALLEYYRIQILPDQSRTLSRRLRASPTAARPGWLRRRRGGTADVFQCHRQLSGLAGQPVAGRDRSVEHRSSRGSD